LVLAEQLRDILLRSKIAPRFYIEREKIDKNKTHHKKSYRIEWQENPVSHYSYFYEKEGVSYWISPIRETKKRYYKGDTFDLTVLKDHSYLATNFIVGNCGKGGDIFTFVQEIEGIEFPEALRILAQKAGVELKSFRPESIGQKTERERLYEICETSCSFFQKQLEKSSVGQKTKEYLLKRGLSDESIKKWRLGYSPNPSVGGWRILSDFLVGRGYKREEVVKSGLAIDPGEGKPPYDRFRNRIIYPILDLNSRVIGFSGRVLDSDLKEKGSDSNSGVPKYLNISNTLLYNKSEVLYGLNFAKIEIRKKDFVVLTEGYMDTIMAHQSGESENTVAVSGTALTPFQLKILRRYTPNLLVSFDMDIAGDLATKRGIELAQKEDFDIRVIKMPQGSDPADVILESPKKWQELVEKAEDIFSFYFESALSKYDRETPKGKKNISKALLPEIKQISNKIIQTHWIQKLAKSVKVGEEAIWEELKKISGKKSGEEVSPDETSSPSVFIQKDRKELLEEKILSLIFKNPLQLKEMNESTLPHFSPSFQKIISVLFKMPSIDEETFKKTIQKLEEEGEEIKKILNNAGLMAEIEDFGFDTEQEEELKDEVGLCLKELKKIELKDKMKKISEQIQQAEEEGNQKNLAELIEEFKQVAKEIG